MSLNPVSRAEDDRSFIAARLGAHPTTLGTNENDPASAPTLPGHDPRNPKREIGMDVRDHTSELRTVANLNLISNSLARLTNVDRVESMDLRQLRDAHCGLKTALDVICAVMIQPRFLEPDQNYNDAGKLLEDFRDLLDGFRDVIVEEVKGRHSSSKSDAECRAEVLVLSEIEFGGDWDDIAHEASVGAGRVRGFRRGI